MSTEFFRTLMGRAFYERDVPAIRKSLGRIAESLERLAKVPAEEETRIAALKEALEIIGGRSVELAEHIDSLEKEQYVEVRNQG